MEKDWKVPEMRATFRPTEEHAKWGSGWDKVLLEFFFEGDRRLGEWHRPNHTPWNVVIPPTQTTHDDHTNCTAPHRTAR